MANLMLSVMGHLPSNGVLIVGRKKARSDLEITELRHRIEAWGKKAKSQAILVSARKG